MQSDNNKVGTFKDNLLALLKERGETITTVAKATGIPRSTLQEWSSGRKPLLDKSIVKLARHFGVSTERLITGQDPEEDLIDKFTNEMKDGFMTLHSGVYRLHLEKFVGTPAKKKSSKDGK